MAYINAEFNEIRVSMQFTAEDDFSYFCKYDNLTGVVATSNVELPALADSCYVNRADVFSMPKLADKSLPPRSR